MKTKHSKSGFSVVELMVAMLAFGIMVTAVGIIMVYAWHGWRDFNEMVGMQRDATIAMRVISKEIRNSNIDEISGDSDSLDFIDGTTRTSAFVFNSSDIAYSRGVQLASWTTPVKGSNYVDIAFTLRTALGGHQKTYATTIYPRNKP